MTNWLLLLFLSSMGGNKKIRCLRNTKIARGHWLSLTYELTLNDKYPLPNISDLLNQFGKCEYFNTLDLVNSFHQIETDPKDISKTAFCVENGHFEFRTWALQVMNNILLGIQNEQSLYG